MRQYTPVYRGGLLVLCTVLLIKKKEGGRKGIISNPKEKTLECALVNVPAGKQLFETRN